jgi:hypothetical protein
MSFQLLRNSSDETNSRYRFLSARVEDINKGSVSLFCMARATAFSCNVSTKLQSRE